MAIMSDLIRYLERSGGDPTNVDPNAATFAWNASWMSVRANVPPTYGTGFVLTLTACFRYHNDVTASALTQVIQNPKAK